MEFRKNIRLKDYNYSANGYYFVTICAYRAQSLFVVAPSYGANFKKIVEEKINQVSKYYKGVGLDFYVIMPNHIHLILVLNNANVSLPKIINAFKSWVTRDIKKMISAQGAVTTSKNLKYVWQPNYYEHVIRNEKSLSKIREYIENNPLAGKLDWNKLDI
ncbi:MAG: transposase [Elusimicrobiales bacterium]|nr:transposase [Elusimicrobiales bacterium]MCK5105977.1 transposase [Elusimicrobiales bacterium]MCK5357643.1 transposase [Elusimicrobiales bacterium]